MKILFVSVNTNPLAPSVNGDGQRTRLLYEACSRIADVKVISFPSPPNNTQYNNKLDKWKALMPYGDVTSLFPIIREREAVIDAAVQNDDYDYIVSRYFYRAIPCGLWKYRDKLVIDFDDALPFYFSNQIHPTSAWTTRTRLNLAARKANTVSRRAVKQLHAAFFAEESVAKSNKGVFLPNIPFYSNTCPDVDWNATAERIIFVGQLDYQPNREGLNRFLEKVYIPLKKRVPNVEMHVVGKIINKSMRDRWQGYPDVTVTGFVDDLKEEYEQSKVVVVPIYQCGATNIKLLEAMAMNRACVTTLEAFEKLHGQFENGKDLFAASNDEEYIEMLVSLLSDEKENLRISHNAKSIMENYYSFDSFCQIVKNAIIK